MAAEGPGFASWASWLSIGVLDDGGQVGVVDQGADGVGDAVAVALGPTGDVFVGRQGCGVVEQGWE